MSFIPMQLMSRLLLVLFFAVVFVIPANAQVPAGPLTQDGAPTTGHCLKSTAPGFAGDAGWDCLNPDVVVYRSGLIAGRCATIIDTYYIGSAANPCVDPNTVVGRTGSFTSGNCIQANSTTSITTVAFPCLNPSTVVLRGGLVAAECVVAVNVGQVRSAGFPCTNPNAVVYNGGLTGQGYCAYASQTWEIKNINEGCFPSAYVTYHDPNGDFGADGQCLVGYYQRYAYAVGFACMNPAIAVTRDLNDPRGHFTNGACLFGYWEKQAYSAPEACMNPSETAWRDRNTNGGNYTAGQCLTGNYEKYTYSVGFPCANPYSYRQYTWTTAFYASVGGSSTSGCDAANPCELQRAINVAMSYDAANNDITIYLGGGVYGGSYHIKGPLPGISGGGVRYLTLSGVGSGSTVIDPAGFCANTMNLDMGALAVFQNMTIQNVYAYNTNCGGSALTILTGSTAMYSNDFQIGPASWAGIMLFDRSAFKCKGDLYGMKFYGGSRNYGIVGSTQSVVVLCGGGANGAGAGHIVRSGYYPTFIDLIDASSFNPGLHSLFYQNEQGQGGPCTDVTFVCATGAKFFAVVNSWIDMEAIHLTNLPGNLIAHVGVGSSILNNDGNLGACTYGQLTAFGMCPAQNQNWGIGDSGTVRILQPGEIGGGASGWGGRVELIWGNPNIVEVGGYVYVYLPYALQGPTNNGGICIAGLGLESNGNNFWPNYATVRALYSNGTPYLLIKWNAPGLSSLGVNTQRSYIDYLCH